MTTTIHLVYGNVGTDMRHPGPFDVFYARETEERWTYLTSMPHYVFWNGFPLNYGEPIRGYQEVCTFMREFQKSIK